MLSDLAVTHGVFLEVPAAADLAANDADPQVLSVVALLALDLPELLPLCFVLHAKLISTDNALEGQSRPRLQLIFSCQ